MEEIDHPHLVDVHALISILSPELHKAGLVVRLLLFIAALSCFSLAVVQLTGIEKRHLRVNNEAPDVGNMEERSPNVDTLTKDTASKVSKLCSESSSFVLEIPFQENPIRHESISESS
ncbi:Avh59 [Phytophthora palmivora]|uniref:Avh59 n=1 Tax=Phytophthora palmivora TaxID=4796 RepID=A0A2P4XVT9_9STRA|nr:Avh59 [Phytophthora palmivora]